MIKFVAGVITGIVLSTIGFQGLVQVADAGVQKVQAVSKEAAK